MSPKAPLKVCLVQMNSCSDLNKNLLECEARIKHAAANDCDLIIFPECVLLWAKTEITHREAKDRQGWIDLLSPISPKYKIAIIWGGLGERAGEDVFNSSFIFDCEGELINVYRKTHLFQIFSSQQKSMDETKIYQHGDTGPIIVEISGWSIGISICYDLRFPEFVRNYAGCDLIINTAAFTKRTGKAHWEVLMRARAIENQSYVIGSAQCGVNQLTSMEAYGHSLLIDPWGELIQDLGEEPSCEIFTLDYKRIIDTREQIPSLYTSFPGLRPIQVEKS
ncbi:hypothetical protein PQO03_05445 [Lentisphaera profundi]|uniref:CN hydrolase domain-containing protein n=1 Tax=Lentisphaera profundi TaxID=1658616 RepID=A0ABY7VT81_9BACT|nr:nitrilase-related carbon-nitrogen hydrolase [Lentisphaera profundi]WDE97395.1 hypothetical protein PQO03_05445 [Lentisphaera profundi]